MRGRKPKPVEIRALEGNPGKRPIRGSSAKSWVDEMKKVKKSVKKGKKHAEKAGAVRRKVKKAIKAKKDVVRGKAVVKSDKRRKKDPGKRKAVKKKDGKRVKGVPVKVPEEEKRQQNGGVEVGTPLCPAWLDATAKREWRRIAPVLKRLGLLTVVDRAAMAGYCQAYARWREAELTVSAQGMVQTNAKSGRSEASPEVRVAQRYLEICKNFCTEFGMTPSARGRMVLPSEKQEADEFEKMLDS